MATERSDAVYGQWLAAKQQFDYFVLGLGVALVGYLGGQGIQTELGSNPGTLRLAAGAFLLLAVVTGLLGIQAHLTLMVVMQKRLYAGEVAGAHAEIALRGGTHVNTSSGHVVGSAEAAATAELMQERVAQMRAEEQRLLPRANMLGRLRDTLLVLGLTALLAAQAWTAAASGAGAAG